VVARLNRLNRLDLLTRLHPLDLAWTAFSVLMLALMVQIPHLLTIPYHLIFVSLTLLYGFRLWTPPTITAVLLAITALTGAIFAWTVSAGFTAPDDVAEVPLMPLITALMAWHAWRGSQARRALAEVAALESERVEQQREFLRDSSHAIRTPVTIARGHVELLRMGVDDPQQLEDTDVVLHQLDRLHHLAGRLLLIEQLRMADGLHRSAVPVLTFIATVGQRWRQSVPRRWVVSDDLGGPDGPGTGALGQVLADEHRLEEAVDALVENALRFTGPDDTVRITALPDGGYVRIEVADSGPGVPAAEREKVFQRFFHRHPSGEEPGTGLGLALVSAVAQAHGGRCWVEVAPEGGAQFVLRLPRAPVSGSSVSGSSGDRTRADRQGSDRQDSDRPLGSQPWPQTSSQPTSASGRS
jgi:signal transduction histidine kinase